MTGNEIVFFLITVFSFILIGKKIEEKYNIPQPVTLITLSASIMPYLNIFHIDFSVLMIVLLPLLLISDALHLKIKDLKENWGVIFYSAFVAVILSIVAGTFILKEIFDYEYTYFITLLSIIMATDAISVSVVFEKFKSMPKKIKFIAESESLFNDATAVIIFTLLALPLINGNQEMTLNGLTLGALKVVLISTSIGLITGFIFSYIMSLYHDTIDEFLIIPLTAYISFIIAEHFHVSGILAVVVSIVILKDFITKNFKIFQEDDLEGVTKKEHKMLNIVRLKEITTLEKLKENESILSYISFIAIGVLFVSLGAVITFQQIAENFSEILIIFLVTTMIRFVVFTPMIITKLINLKDNLILTFAGIKGGLAILLVHMIPETFKYKEHIEVVVFGQILLSTLIYVFLLLYFIPRFYKNEEIVEEIH
jgi:monovalent cation:H+ antiporter, CPA1 family